MIGPATVKQLEVSQRAAAEEAEEAERRAEGRRKWREKYGDKSPLEVIRADLKRIPRQSD